MRPVSAAVSAPAPAPAGVGAGVGDGPARPDEARLRQAARQLTGVFAQQLFKAMRETVPQDEGVVSGGSGEEMFTGMLDEHLAGATPGRPGATAEGPGAAFTRSLADAVFRRLRPHAPDAAPIAAPADPAGSAVTPAAAGASVPGAAPAAPAVARR
jgi:flagellar protein FlgJ